MRREGEMPSRPPRMGHKWARVLFSGDEEPAALHNLLFAALVFEPDVEAESHDVDVSG